MFPVHGKKCPGRVPGEALFSSTFPHVSQKQTRQRGSSGAASLLGGKLRAIGITTTNWAGETPSELLGIISIRN